MDANYSKDTPLTNSETIIFEKLKKWRFKLSKELNDIFLLLDINPSEQIKQKNVQILYFDNPEINKKINILKQIYESGDETLICGIDLCLKGAYEDFLGRKKKKIG